MSTSLDLWNKVEDLACLATIDVTGTQTTQRHTPLVVTASHTHTLAPSLFLNAVNIVNSKFSRFSLHNLLRSLLTQYKGLICGFLVQIKGPVDVTLLNIVGHRIQLQVCHTAVQKFDPKQLPQAFRLHQLTFTLKILLVADGLTGTSMFASCHADQTPCRTHTVRLICRYWKKGNNRAAFPNHFTVLMA